VLVRSFQLVIGLILYIVTDVEVVIGNSLRLPGTVIKI